MNILLIIIVSELFRSCLRDSSEGESDIDVIEEVEEDDEDEEEEEEEEESGSGDENQAVLENCFLAMVDTLAKQVCTLFILLFHYLRAYCF